MNNGPERLAAAWSEFENELDWELLGQTYCVEGGEEFFPPEQREALLDAALKLANDVSGALDSLPDGTLGRSLYIGAALAEVPILLVEALVLGRKVLAFNLDAPEPNEINRALAAVQERLGFALPTLRLDPLPREIPRSLGDFDHLWVVSVFTDPEAFPSLHDELYERRGTELATGKGDARRERDRAKDICHRLARGLTKRSVVSTTKEELPFLLEALEHYGMVMENPERARLSPIVGDPVVVSTVRPI